MPEFKAQLLGSLDRSKKETFVVLDLPKKLFVFVFHFINCGK